jgi:hypothetical protein
MNRTTSLTSYFTRDNGKKGDELSFSLFPKVPYMSSPILLILTKVSLLVNFSNRIPVFTKTLANI